MKKKKAKESKKKTTKKAAKKGAHELEVDLSAEGIKKFIKYFEATSVAELTIGEKGKRITAKKDVVAKPQAVKIAPQEVGEESVSTDEDSYEESTVVKSTFVGSFKPVKGIAIGKDIEAGETVANVYSMNMDHDIKVDEGGTVEKILVEENDPIEYGQPLIIIG